jgi:hypothetical protein
MGSNQLFKLIKEIKVLTLQRISNIVTIYLPGSKVSTLQRISNIVTTYLPGSKVLTLPKYH